MPTRIIRDGILSSESVASLSWRAEVFYRRLMSVVDDYGRHDARAVVLRAALYPLQLDRMSNSDIQGCLDEVETAGLVRIYYVAGRSYLEICKFGQRIRTAAKWPAPPDENDASSPHVAADCGRLRQIAGTDGDGDEDEVGDEGERLISTLPCSSTPGADEVRRVMGSLMLAPLTGRVLQECAERFMDSMEASGWLDGRGVPIRNWQAAARNWARRYAENELRNPAANKTTNNRRKDCNDPSRYK